MNKVKHRAMSALIIAALIIVGLGVYIIRYFESGAKWATFAVGGYTSGGVSMGKSVPNISLSRIRQVLIPVSPSISSALPPQ